MDSITAEQASFLRDVQLGTLPGESRLTATVLRAVPEGKADYKPDPSSRTALDLVRHIAIADTRFIETIANGEFSLAKTLPDEIVTPAAVAAWYEDRYAKALDRLAAMDGEALRTPIDFRGFFTRPAIFFAGFGLNHTIHHRGQLSAYLRAMGGRVPSIYGESFDAAEARKAAAT